MKTFKLIISAAESLVCNGQAVYCSLSTEKGSLGIEAGHEAFLGVLKENSQLRFRDEKGTETTVLVETGIVWFRDNECLLTVSI
jgi:F0F1-type ATP synthase epsilon subunit